MSETAEELKESMLGRLRSMSTDNGNTWDLSPKDQAAIQYALDHIEELSDVLRSARCIADRKGADTAWERFSERIGILGIGSVTAKVFKVLPSDTEGEGETEKSKTIDCLNEAFARDPVAIHSLLSNRVLCNQQLADDPFVIVGYPMALPKQELWEVTALGLLNGVLTANGLPVVASKWSAPGPEGRLELLGFCAAGVQDATRSW